MESRMYQKQFSTASHFINGSSFFGGIFFDYVLRYTKLIMLLGHLSNSPLKIKLSCFGIFAGAFFCLAFSNS
jgi:hypothetical protein